MEDILSRLAQTGGLGLFVWFLIRGLQQKVSGLQETLNVKKETLEASKITLQAMEARAKEAERLGESYRKLLDDLPQDLDKYKQTLRTLKDEVIRELEDANQRKDQKLANLSQTKLQPFVTQRGTYMQIPQLLTVAALGTSLSLCLAQDSSSFRTLYTFTGVDDDGSPYGRVAGQNRTLYGTANGLSGFGTVFSLAPPASPGGAWTETVLHAFTGGSDGAAPFAGVVIDKSGVLYGTAFSGGTANYGVVFSLTPASPGGAWTETVLHEFTGPDGANPSGGVVLSQNGVLFGTTQYGGTSGGHGTVFSLTPPASPGGAWTETVLYAFADQPDGANPEASLVIGESGVLYGTTSNGGTAKYGTVFSLTPPASPGGAWTEAVLYSFTGGSDGGKVYYAGVVIGTGGLLYGTTVYGGSHAGTVFSLTPPASPGGAWTKTVLHAFTGGSDGANPYAGVVIGTSGVLYGTTYQGAGTENAGTVFSLTPPASPGGAWTFTLLHTFTRGSDGADATDLAISTNGVLLGTTSRGGTGTCDCGTVFALKP